MRKTTYLLMVTSLLFWISNSLAAQKVTTAFSKEKAEKMAEIQTSKMVEILDLTTGQKAKVYEINYKAAENTLKSQDKAKTKPAYEEKLRTIRNGQKEAIAAILNPTQKVKWAEINQRYEAKKANEVKSEERNRQD